MNQHCRELSAREDNPHCGNHEKMRKVSKCTISHPNLLGIEMNLVGSAENFTFANNQYL
jgi:hypothetical protein